MMDINRAIMFDVPRTARYPTTQVGWTKSRACDLEVAKELT
jgi:hypothetical protein